MMQTSNYNTGITTRGMRKNPIMNKTHVMQTLKRNEILDLKKNRTNNVKKNNNQQNDENQLPLAPITKKIQKVAYHLTNQKLKISNTTPTRKPFQDLTNNKNNMSDSSNEKTPKISSKYLEDNVLTERLNQGAKTTLKSHHHAVVQYTLPKSYKVLQFSCFLDRELKIPEKYMSRTINHSVDNDVETDDDQIQSAIRNVSKSVEEAYQQNKQQFFQQQQKQKSPLLQSHQNSNQKSSISVSE